jgi:hypothetical protein
VRAVAVLPIACAFVAGALLVSDCGSAFGTSDQDAATEGGDVHADSVVVGDAPTDGGMVGCGNTPGASELFAAPASIPDQVATDGIYVYWASTSNGVIGRARAGAGPATVEPVAVRASTVEELGVSSSYVCWVLLAAQGTSGVLECGATGAIPAGGLTSAEIQTYASTIGQLEARPSNFLYARAGLNLLGPPSMGVVAFNTPRIFASASPTVVLVLASEAGANNFYTVQDTQFSQSVGAPFFVDPKEPTALATDGTDVFVVYANDQTVSRLPYDGGGATPLATGHGGLGAIVLDGDNVYFTTGTGTMRVAKDGTCATQIAPEPTKNIAIAADHVYFASGGKILRARK